MYIYIHMKFPASDMYVLPDIHYLPFLGVGNVNLNVSTCLQRIHRPSDRTNLRLGFWVPWLTSIIEENPETNIRRNFGWGDDFFWVKKKTHGIFLGWFLRDDFETQGWFGLKRKRGKRLVSETTPKKK